MRIKSTSGICLSRALITATLLLTSAHAFYVVEGSNCTAACRHGSSGTTTRAVDVSCFDREYNSTETGVSFERCVACELGSHAFNENSGQTDLGWAFYNLRYTLDQCIFAYPNSSVPAAASQCADRCSAISKALRMNIQTANLSSTYDYCADNTLQDHSEACATCLAPLPNQLFLANFVRTLAAACNIVTSPVNPFPISSSSIFTSDPPSNYSNVNDTAVAPSHNGLSHNAKVAVAISVPVGVFLLASIAIVVIFVHRDTRRLESQTKRQSSRKSNVGTNKGLHSRSTTGDSIGQHSHHSHVSHVAEKFQDLTSKFPLPPTPDPTLSIPPPSYSNHRTSPPPLKASHSTKSNATSYQARPASQTRTLTRQTSPQDLPQKAAQSERHHTYSWQQTPQQTPQQSSPWIVSRDSRSTLRPHSRGSKGHQSSHSQDSQLIPSHRSLDMLREAQPSPAQTTTTHPARDRNSPIPFFEKRIEIPVPHSTPIKNTPIMTPSSNQTPTSEKFARVPPLPAVRYDPETGQSTLSQGPRPSRMAESMTPESSAAPPSSSYAMNTAGISSDHNGQIPSQAAEPLTIAPTLQAWARAQEQRQAEKRLAAAAVAMAGRKATLTPRPPSQSAQPENRHGQKRGKNTALTTFAIPSSSSSSSKPHSSSTPRRERERLNWDTIAAQNAKIRAGRGTTPSPVSPMTIPSVFSGARSRPVSGSGGPGSSNAAGSGIGIGSNPSQGGMSDIGKAIKRSSSLGTDLILEESSDEENGEDDVPKDKTHTIDAGLLRSQSAKSTSKLERSMRF